MADQIEVSKLNELVYTAPPVDNIAVSKLIMYVWAVPGDSEGDTSNRQGHVYGRETRRLRS